MMLIKQSIQLRRRIVDNNIDLPSDLPPLLRRIYASRGIRSSSDLELGIKGMLPWWQLSGIEKATNMLYEAFCADMRIVIVGDFDTDGATSTALSILCLLALGYDNVAYLMPSRFKNGYGLSPEIVDQAHKCGAQMIITVDNGISSHEGIARAHQLMIPVLITDHHLPGKILPDAEVIINPNSGYCNFPSKALAGVGVVFYLMLAFRVLLKDKGWFISRGIVVPNITEYLDLVALGTVADVVPLDTNNRILIWQGLNRIRSGKCRPGIKALLEIAKRNISTVVTNDLSFILGPRINAAGRLDDISISVSLLLCDDLNEARILANRLEILNQNRKAIEYEMQTKALYLCEELKFNNNTLPNSLVMYHSDWHQGVSGILAARIKERFHRPVIIFASAGNGILKGSGRSIHGLNMRDVLEQINILYPGLVIKFGGHAMAVGLILEIKQFNKFRFIFNKLITDWIEPSLLNKVIISDGQLLPNEMNINVAQMIRNAGPWGHMFPEPLFDGHFYLLYQHIVGINHLKVKVKSTNGGPLINGIIFNIDKTFWPNTDICVVELVYKLDINEFRGNYSMQIIIDHIWPL